MNKEDLKEKAMRWKNREWTSVIGTVLKLKIDSLRFVGSKRDIHTRTQTHTHTLTYKYTKSKDTKTQRDKHTKTHRHTHSISKLSKIREERH